MSLSPAHGEEEQVGESIEMPERQLWLEDGLEVILRPSNTTLLEVILHVHSLVPPWMVVSSGSGSPV